MMVDHIGCPACGHRIRKEADFALIRRKRREGRERDVIDRGVGG